jgi:N-acyl homoserine lactone hydrolase
MRRTWRLCLNVLGLLLAAGAGALLVRNRPLPEASPRTRAAPALNLLPKVRVCWVEYTKQQAPGQAATAGWSRTSPWNVTTSGLVIRHPRGDVVVDVGFSSHYADEIAEYPLARRLFYRMLRTQQSTTTPNMLRAVGVDPDRLRWLILSHAHIDHAGGVIDLPHVPVLIPQEEIDFLDSSYVIPAHAKAIAPRARAIAFEPRPYETFDESADVFGDGSIVLVKLFGHTPGSAGTFVNVSATRRFFHVGDAVNVMEGIERRLPKSVVMARTDNDPPAANGIVTELARLHALLPEVSILPAHDRDAWSRAFGGQPGCIE